MSKKTDDFRSLEKIAFVLADETKKLLLAELVCVVEYTYSKTEVLSCIPAKTIDKALIYPHEVFYILKTLQQENIHNIDENAIHSEHLKQYFPLFNYKKYKIIPIYSDELRIITLEIYGETKSVMHLKKNILSSITEIFQKTFLSRIMLEKDMLKVTMNETIIKFLDRIRNTLDEEELEKIILEEISHSFGADRSFFIRSYIENPQVPRMGKEYLANPYAKSLIGNNLDYKSVWEQLKETQVNPPVFVIENSEKFIKQNKLENSPIDIFIRESQIKSSYPFLIYEDAAQSMYLVLQFTRRTVILDKNDFEVMELLSKQAHIALVQAKLYSNLIQNSKEEKLLIDLISTIRSSFTLSKIANEFTTKVGLFFDAERCTIRFFDQNKKEFKGYSEAFEYKKNYIVTGTKDMNLQKELGEFLLNSEKFHDTITIRYSKDLTGKDFEFKADIIKYFERYNTKTYLGAFVRYNGILLGILALQFKDDINIKRHQEELIKALADQMGIAIYQSELYFNIQNVAKKEKFLKEIYVDTLGMQTKEQLYRYFSEKLSLLLGTVGSVFIEFKDNNNKEYFEYYQDNYKGISNHIKSDFLQEIINKKKDGYYCNLPSEDINRSFIKRTGITCIGYISVDNDKSVIIFFDKKRDFTTFEKNMLTSLIEVISKTIKDIMQQTEIKKLRETFLSTLTHDLQVPIIAQRNAIEYLQSVKNSNEEKTKEILDYLKESNEQVFVMIKILSAIYRYEAGKKELSKTEFNMYQAMDETIQNFSELLEKNNMTINKKYDAEFSEIFADKTEIKKILVAFFTNILDVAQNGEIKIEIKNNNKSISCCLGVENANFSPKLSETIFDRDSMALKLDRLIGEGLSLYLGKLIALAHGGKIYINEHGSGNIFCLELPII
ncbi:MAG: GAF domain-containing sensor histidine kinase [bacterium]|nr:GAF domain-containing sensor histidine kinase [bacterium]